MTTKAEATKGRMAWSDSQMQGIIFKTAAERLAEATPPAQGEKPKGK